jgi:hypothetical protein
MPNHRFTARIACGLKAERLLDHAYDRSDGVKMVGYQLHRKQGESSAGLPAFKPGDGHFLFLEGIYLDGISPVGLSLVVAAIPSTQRTPRTNNGIPINLSCKICFFVFPNIPVCVIVSYLYFW